jgi:hypothetical protein
MIIDPHRNITILTSDPYPIRTIERVATQFEILSGWCVTLLPTGKVRAGLELVSGALTLTVAYVTYSNWRIFQPDQAVATFELDSGSLIVTVAYVTYSNPPDEAITSFELISGDLTVTVVFITYSNWRTLLPDQATTSFELVSGSLT